MRHHISNLSDKMDQQILGGTEGLFTGNETGQSQRLRHHVLCELSQSVGLWPR